MDSNTVYYYADEDHDDSHLEFGVNALRVKHVGLNHLIVLITHEQFFGTSEHVSVVTNHFRRSKVCARLFFDVSLVHYTNHSSAQTR